MRDALELPVTNILREARSVTDAYRNVVLTQTNESCVRLSTFETQYPWHVHERSDETFVVVEGILEIEIADGPTLRMLPWDLVTIPAGTIHRTRAIGRTANLTFEHLDTDTRFVDPPSPTA